MGEQARMRDAGSGAEIARVLDDGRVDEHVAWLASER